MNDLLRMALINAGMAGALAVLAGLTARFLRRPAWVHGLWLLVLLKLVTPPLLGVAILPRPGSVTPEPVAVAAGPAVPAVHEALPTRAAPEPATPTSPTSSTSPGALTTPGPVAEAPTAGFGLGEAAMVLWFGGSLAVLVLTLLRGRRFRRLLREARPAESELQHAADAIARRMGIRRCPPVLTVPAAVSPMLWWRAGRVAVLFPVGLLVELSIAERDTLLAHEMAHLKRRDHWVRLLEVAATSGFWWHPAVWWARAGLRRSEEHSCDSWVVRTLPGLSRAYADALLKTLSFLSNDGRRLPALASGVGEVRDYEERLTMILQRSKPPVLARPYRLVLAALAVAVLLAFPTWAKRVPPEPPAAPAPVAEPSPTPAVDPAPAPPVEPGPVPVVDPAPAPFVEPGPVPVAEPALAPPAPPAPPAQLRRGSPGEPMPAPPAVPTAAHMPVPAPRAQRPEQVGADGVADAVDGDRMTSEERRRQAEELAALQARARELETELRKIRELQGRLSKELQGFSSDEEDAEMDRLRQEMDRLESSGRADDAANAEELRRQAEMLQREMQMERELMDARRAHESDARAYKEEYARMLEEPGEDASAAATEERIYARLKALEADCRAQELATRERYEGMAREQYKMEMSQAEALRSQGDLRQAEEYERQLELMRFKQEEMQRRNITRIELQIQELQQLVEKFEAGGEFEKSDRIRAMIDELQLKLDEQIW